jgi:hypothetical protein
VVAKFKYDKEWLEKNALTVCVDQETYDALTKKVRDFDLEEKHSGPKNDGTNQQETDQTNDTAMEAGKEKSTVIGETKDTMMEAANDTAMEAGKEKSTVIGETKDTIMEAANDTAMEAGIEKSTVIGETKDTMMEAVNDHQEISQTNDPMTEIGETKDTMMEAAKDHPKISQTNDPMMELPASDENVNLSTTVVTQDVTFTNDAEQLRDINGELRNDGVVKDDCVTSTAVAKAISNDSFVDDLVDTEEEDLGKDDAAEHNVCVVSRKSGTVFRSVGK